MESGLSWAVWRMDHTEISGDQEMLKCERPSVGVREVPDQTAFVFTGTQREVQLVESGGGLGGLWDSPVQLVDAASVAPT